MAERAPGETDIDTLRLVRACATRQLLEELAEGSDHRGATTEEGMRDKTNVSPTGMGATRVGHIYKSQVALACACQHWWVFGRNLSQEDVDRQSDRPTRGPTH